MFTYPLKSSLRSLAVRLSRLEVLIIDPDAEIAKVVMEVLRYVGFEKITLATNANKGLEILRERNVDLLITDWQAAPNGVNNLVQYLRTSPDSPNPFVPIIMLTGKSEKHEVEIARDSGVTELISKPFTPKRLFERIVMIIENPRSFVVSPNYRGPDRRRRTDIPPSGQERRIHRIVPEE